jgi:hypothetical protein
MKTIVKMCQFYSDISRFFFATNCTYVNNAFLSVFESHFHTAL